LGEKIDKDQAWVRRVIRRRTKMVQIRGCEEEGTIQTFFGDEQRQIKLFGLH
jgi:hypothetical protein